MHWWLTLLMNHAKFKYPAWYKPTMASYRPPVTKKKLTYQKDGSLSESSFVNSHQ
uniref:Uncharacterized protein MANES_04G031200 n=1 Tax=Rhizophora mucronata TaxID=61149 RepID=A0A2P2J7G2_RHIMU